jgi:hypothetical protein
MAAAQTFDRHAAIGVVAASFSRFIQRSFWPLAVICAVEFAVLALSADKGATAFALITAGSLVALGLWMGKGQGLPIVPMIAVQNLAIYALPIAIHNEGIAGYPAAMLTGAGIEVLTFDVAMIAAWRITMELVPTYTALCWALQGFDRTSARLIRMGIGLIVAGTAYQLLESAGLLAPVLDLLPEGSNSIIKVLVSGSSACGFFLSGMMEGRGVLTRSQSFLFWSLLAAQCLVGASGFLLSALLTMLFSALIGLFWGSGKIPWRLLTVSFALLAFFNLGKFTMRERYWHPKDDEPAPAFGLMEMPRTYTEWFGASVDAITGTETPRETKSAFNSLSPDPVKSDNEQTLFARINNLQNLLYVIDVMQTSKIPALGGATYSLIPPLLIPRVLWPNKPRSHEGQVLLNVYFGRQDIMSTYQTYIAWGLIPEAYGNFGPITGAIVLGVFIGLIFAWIEKYVAKKLLLSMEGFLSFTVFLGMANSYEMVASVLVTSLFQACIPIILASAPFVERLLPRRSDPETE